jgi:hypothetical protein
MSLVSKLRPFEHEVGVSLLNTTLQIIDVEVDIKRYALTDVHKRFQFSRSASGYGSWELARAETGTISTVCYTHDRYMKVRLFTQVYVTSWWAVPFSVAHNFATQYG